MTSQLPSYRGYRFPAEIISHAVWLYYRFCLSFRDGTRYLMKTCHHYPTTYGGLSTDSPIHQPFAIHAADSSRNPKPVIYVSRVMTELELVQVVRQMLSADAVKGSHHATFDQAEHAFNRVRVNIRPHSHILPSTMAHRFMPALECLADRLVEVQVVGDEPTGEVCVLCNDLAHAGSR